MVTPRSNAPRTPLADARLCLVADANASRLPLVVGVEAAIRGGADVVQFRDKLSDDEAFTAAARRVAAVCRAHGVLFVVNDRVHVAAAVVADGVHLGQDDASVADARELLGPGKLVGVSTHDADELERALADGADYVGLGSVFPTSTKTTPVPVVGPADLAPLAAAAEAQGVPAFAIGGVTGANAADLAAAGIRRAASCAGILGCDDPERAARVIRAALDVTPPDSPSAGARSSPCDPSPRDPAA
jgi:thiamine-phosphate pyrophosphorylase